MDAKTCIDNLFERQRERLGYRGEKIDDITSRGICTYDKLSEISHQIELLTVDLRETLIVCHNELQALGYCPRELPMPSPPELDVWVEGNGVRIVMAAMLPFPLKGGVHYLHETLDAALLRLVREEKLPQPLFEERCAVVFIHHYAMTETNVRNMRDYDNVEKRCITNVIARHFLKDDSPSCYVSMDVLAPGDRDYTEISMMPIPEFRAFVTSENIDFTAEGTVSKKVPKTYQKTPP